MYKITAKASNRFAKAVISFVLVLLTLFAPLAEIAPNAELFSVTAYAADSYTYTYYPKTSYTGGSIVDGLKSIGVDSSWSNRAKIAALNGISNYSSTASQNIKLLNLLKSGKLVKSKTINPGGASIPNGKYILVSGLASNKALDINGCSTADRANVQLWTLNYSDAQILYIESVGNGYYKITNVHSGKVLDIVGASRTPGTNVFQYTYNGGANEHWRFKDAGGGYYYIESQLGDLYLDVNEARTADGTNIKIWKFNDSTNAQKWKLLPYSSPSASTNSTSVKLNVPALKQYDTRWANYRYAGSTTIKRSGCLLTCVTMVMSYLDGKSYRPDEYSKKLSFTSGGGLIWPSGWQRRSSLDLSVLKAQLDRGNPVIVGGQGKAGQHYVVVYGYTNGGRSASNFLVNDSGHTAVNLQQHINNYGQVMRYHV